MKLVNLISTEHRSLAECPAAMSRVLKTTALVTPRRWPGSLPIPREPRLVISIDGTRNYGVGLTRAAALAGLAVIEVEQSTRKHSRARDQSERIDAHLAVLYALGLDANKLPTPRSDGDREALGILLCARQELATTTTGRPTGCATATRPAISWPEPG